MRNIIKKILKESLKDVYITDESYSCLVTEDEEWILLRNNDMARKPIPTLIKTDNLDVNTLGSCYLINDRMLELNWKHFRKASKVFLKDTMNGQSTVDNNFTLKIVKFKDGMILDKPVDTHSLFESEDDFSWVEDIVPQNHDLSAGAVYRKFGLHEGTKDYITQKVCEDLNDVTYVDGKVIMAVDSYCDFSELFHNGDGQGRVNKYLAEQILCEKDDWWEPYHSSDLIGRRDWKSKIWDDLVVPDKRLLDIVLNNIKKNYVSKVNYNPNQLDIFGELPKKQNVVKINDKVLDTEYFDYLTKNLDELGDLIDDEEDFEDIKHELTWAYGDAYNTAARDEIYKATMKPIEENFGKGEWGSKEIQKMGGMVTRDFIKYDITELFLGVISDFFDNCWDNCSHNSEDIEEMEEECEECKSPGSEYSNFLDLYRHLLDENNDEFDPRFDEWPDDNDVEKYFIESVLDRL